MRVRSLVLAAATAAAPASALLPQQPGLPQSHVAGNWARGGAAPALGSTTLDCDRIDHDLDDASFLSECGVPTWKAGPSFFSLDAAPPQVRVERLPAVPGAFVLHDVCTPAECEALLEATDELGFGSFDAGSNRHGALQVLVDGSTGDGLFARIRPYLPATALSAAAAAAATVATTAADVAGGSDCRGSTLCGINARWRFYKYAPDGRETFAPHIDAAWTGSGLDESGKHLLWDAYGSAVRSRYTLLLYLNGDFTGGETTFFRPEADRGTAPRTGAGTGTRAGTRAGAGAGEAAAEGGSGLRGGEGEEEEEEEEGEGEEGMEEAMEEAIAAVRPRQGSVLIFPQAVGEEARDHARVYWPMHEGTPLRAGKRGKYVVRSDVLYRDDDKL